jgi:hypothetical protein
MRFIHAMILSFKSVRFSYVIADIIFFSISSNNIRILTQNSVSTHIVVNRMGKAYLDRSICSDLHEL